MSLTADKKKWDDLHAALAKATEAANAYDRQLHSHYGRYETQWLKKGERTKLEALRDKQDKIGDKIITLLVQVSPRGEAWLSGVPSHWIRNDLTWEDAIRPKGEPLSIVPPTSYGNSTPIREASMTNQDPDPEAAGAAYAQEQLSGDYFANWIHDQLLEASKMDPADVLPLETQSDAMEIAKNMLQQLKWDTSRDLDHGEISAMIGVDDATQDDVKEFFKGFRETCDMNRPWLADELLEINQEMRGRNRSSLNERPRTSGHRRHRVSGSGFRTVSERRSSPPITRVVVRKLGSGWGMKAYDSEGYLRSGISTPSSLDYVKRKAEEWFPGVPVEYEEPAAPSTGKYQNLRIGTDVKIRHEGQEIWVTIGLKSGSGASVRYRGSTTGLGEVRSIEFTPDKIITMRRQGR